MRSSRLGSGTGCTGSILSTLRPRSSTCHSSARKAGGRGAPRDVSERWQAEVDRGGAPRTFVELGEFVLGGGEADVQPLGLADPAFALGFSGIRQSVV
jgi:hypothetical protein